MDQNKFDPDEFYMTKSDILSFVSQVRSHWFKHPFANAKRITSLEFFEVWIRTTTESEVHAIWKLMWKFLYEIQYQNYLAKNKGEKSREAILGNVKRSLAKEIFNA